MTNTEQLVERHIKEYEARLKHIDELMKQAEQAAAAAEENQTLDTELSELRLNRDKLDRELEAMVKKSATDWAQKGGPMVMWDVMAERLEHLIERAEQWRPHH